MFMKIFTRIQFSTSEIKDQCNNYLRQVVISFSSFFTIATKLT